MSVNKLIRLHPLDNILVLARGLGAGEYVEMKGQEICFPQAIGIGHKLAADFIAKGELIIKYGVPIGSATVDIEMGQHIHLHNMKSDYIPTYTIEGGFEQENTI